MILETALILSAITLWLHRTERFLRDALSQRVADREADRAIIAKSVAPPVADPDPIPDDLLAEAASELMPWARQQKLDALYELHGKLKDWAKVRSALQLNAGTI